MGVVVTGAAGFIGRVLVDALLAEGHSVVGVDRLRVENSAKPHDHRVVRADLIDDEPAVRDALATADAVFHLAGCPGVRDAGPGVARRRHRDNVLAARAVLDLVPLDVPLVVTSSSSVYGGSAGGRPSAETDPLRPRGGYARSKLTAERLCAARLAAGGIVAIARPFTVAGEGQRPDMALARWIAAARAGDPLPILGSPLRTRDITDVRDVARVLTALAAREVRGAVNVGTGAGHTLAELVDAVAAVCDTDVRTYVVPAPPVEVTDTLADTRLLRRLVGFVPATDLLDVVGRQAAAACVDTFADEVAV